MAEHPKVITAGLRPWASLLCMKASRASEGFQSFRGSGIRRATALRLKYEGHAHLTMVADMA